MLDLHLIFLYVEQAAFVMNCKNFPCPPETHTWARAELYTWGQAEGSYRRSTDDSLSYIMQISMYIMYNNEKYCVCVWLREESFIEELPLGLNTPLSSIITEGSHSLITLHYLINLPAEGFKSSSQVPVIICVRFSSVFCFCTSQANSVY